MLTALHILVLQLRIVHCKECNVTFISTFHDNMFGEDPVSHVYLHILNEVTLHFK